jgi:anti-sigma B factor antagonist
MLTLAAAYPIKRCMTPPQSRFDLESNERDGAVIVRITGELGITEVDRLRAYLLGFSAKHPALTVFDLSGLDFITSLAMGALAEYRRGVLRHAGQIRLAGLNPNIKEAFVRSGLDDLMPIHETVDQAVQG